MSELPKWFSRLLDWLLPQPKPQQLSPRQEVVGDKAVQVGQVGGSVTIVHLTQHLLTTTVAAQPLTPTVPAPMAQPPAQPAPPHRPSGGVANDDQRHVLQLIRQVPNSEAVHDFMQREFGTRVVIRLQPRQLHRVRRYVEAIMKSGVPLAGTGPNRAAQGNQQ